MITILIKELNGSITIISKNKVVGGTCRKFIIDKATTIRPIPKTQPIRSVFDFLRNKSVIKAVITIITRIISGTKNSKLWRLVIPFTLLYGQNKG
jgi:hypothetical protein